MEERKRAAEEELRQRQEDLNRRREDAERREKEAERSAEHHGRQASQIDERLVRRAVEGRSKKWERLQDMWRLRSEGKQVKAARQDKEAAFQELADIHREEQELLRDQSRHERQNFAYEASLEAGQIHERIAEQYPAYAQDSHVGQSVDNPDEMWKVERFAQDYEQLKQREREASQSAPYGRDLEALQQENKNILREYGLYEHVYPLGSKQEQQATEHDEAEARRQDIARRTGVDIEEQDGDRGEDKGEGRDEGIGY